MIGREAAKIGIALSGGGSRAIAFHLGCLLALDRAGLLPRAKVISTVSGGSVIGALYALHDGPFEAFEARVRTLLRRGLVRPALLTAVTSFEGLKALACFILSALMTAAGLVVRGLSLGHIALPRPRRFASRTTILRRTLHQRVFDEARLDQTARDGRPAWIALAAELRTGSAFYFRAGAVGSWRFGRVASADLTVADAVSASAAFPLFLPALDEVLPFIARDGSSRRERVVLTDGGVYDNLGLAPLWPDRDPDISLEVEDVDLIIACRAGDGLKLGAPPNFFLGRLVASFAAVHERAQNATMKRLFDLKAAGVLAGFLVPYLGQDDTKLAAPPADLVPRDDALGYPIDFSPMPPDWIERLSRRGDQLTWALLQEHHPELLPPDSRAAA